MGDVDFAGLLMDAEMPTLKEAWGCLDCHALRRSAENHRCVVCGSEAVFDAAPALNQKPIEIDLTDRRVD